MDDQAAIDKWKNDFKGYVNALNIPRDDYNGIMAYIDELPSVQPERKNGKWIESGYYDYKAVCSECGEPCATYVMGKPRDKYCKWCGAKMNTEDLDKVYDRLNALRSNDETVN